MFTGTTALVRRRARPDLPVVSTVPQTGSAPGTVVLQMLFGELASMRQQLNALAARPGSVQPVGPTGRQSGPASSEEVESSRMKRMFD
jgi:hypothetical protein